MADAPMLTGVPEVRGFKLDGYGIFFDVEVPALRLPVTWPLRNMFRDNRETTRDRRGAPGDDGGCGAAPAGQARAGRASARAAGAGTIGAAWHGRGSARRRRCRWQVAAPRRMPAAFDNPEEAYTREIKAALVDAMIENSGPHPHWR